MIEFGRQTLYSCVLWPVVVVLRRFEGRTLQNLINFCELLQCMGVLQQRCTCIYRTELLARKLH